MEPILSDADRTEVKKILNEGLDGPVRVDLHTRKSSLVLPGAAEPSESGPIAVQLLGEVAALDPRIELTVIDSAVDPEPAKKAGVEGIDPAMVFRGDKSKGTLRYFGLPAGYEFRTLLDTLIAVSRGDSGLSEPSREALGKVQSPVHLEVYVTPG